MIAVNVGDQNHGRRLQAFAPPAFSSNWNRARAPGESDLTAQAKIGSQRGSRPCLGPLHGMPDSIDPVIVLRVRRDSTYGSVRL